LQWSCKHKSLPCKLIWSMCARLHKGHFAMQDQYISTFKNFCVFMQSSSSLIWIWTAFWNSWLKNSNIFITRSLHHVFQIHCCFSCVSSHVHRSVKISLLNSFNSENDLPKIRSVKVLGETLRFISFIHFSKSFFPLVSRTLANVHGSTTCLGHQARCECKFWNTSSN
jgi:hypothetical protein